MTSGMAGALVAVVGRANVGKSTLVNRLVGRRVAIEHPEPGVTRDRQGYQLEWGGRSFSLVDTGGWEPRARGMTEKIVAQAARAVSEASLILLVLDVRTGITKDDLVVARALRKATAPVLVVANKVDSAAQEADAVGLERLGFGAPLSVSSLHGRGSGDLLDAIVGLLPPEEAADREPGAVRVAIAGRPNVGKSSLLNRLAGEERAIVDETAGTTRDAVDTLVEIGGKAYRFVDTAGIRRRGHLAQGPEYYGIARSMRAIEAAEVVLLLLDASEGVTEQDQRLARMVADEGRAAVVVLNKWDLVDAEAGPKVEDELDRRIGFVHWASRVRVSAKTGRGINRIAPAVDQALASWQQRVPTAALNVWLRDVGEAIPLAGRGGRPPKIRYVTQARTCPPEVVLFATGDISDPGLRALERRLRERFGFPGTPVRFVVRRSAGHAGPRR